MTDVCSGLGAEVCSGAGVRPRLGLGLWVWALAAALLALPGCSGDAGRDTANSGQNAAASLGKSRVNPMDYDAFFLWAGVKPSAALKQAKTVYLLNGEVQIKDSGRLVPLRPATPNVRHARIWMTIRLERLDWDDAVYQHIAQDMERWRGAGNDLVGLQLDFDAKTRGLADYATFLRGIRQRLPQHYQLSVTGLMDWSAGGNSDALAGLGDVVDEVVIQTYQGRHTISGYERYMDSLRRLPMPYRVALVEGGEWTAPPTIQDDPNFQGYVIFLLPEPRQSGR